MEDTQKLTHLAFLEEQEQQLLEDFFRGGRNWDSQKSQRWAKMQAEVYAEKPVFPSVVVALSDRGWDLETARWAAGQATMREPDADFAETFGLAEGILELREAA